MALSILGVLVIGVFFVYWMFLRPFMQYNDIRQITRTAAYRKQMTNEQLAVIDEFVMYVISSDRKKFAASVRSFGLDRSVTDIVDAWVMANVPKE